jgi:hypothetical protein
MEFVNKVSNIKYVIKPTYAEVVNGIRQVKYGESVQFVNGKFETNDKEVIKYLKGHPDFGVMMFANETKEKVEK